MRAKPHKYGAKPTVVDGVKFASKAEARRYQELKLLEKAGEIKSLVLQPGFPMTVSTHNSLLPTCVGEYRADFAYRTRDDQLVVEDVKSQPTKTAVYRLKRKIVEANYGIAITEIR